MSKNTVHHEGHHAVKMGCDTCPFESADPDAIRGHQDYDQLNIRGWLGQYEHHVMVPLDSHEKMGAMKTCACGNLITITDRENGPCRQCVLQARMHAVLVQRTPHTAEPCYGQCHRAVQAAVGRPNGS